MKTISTNSLRIAQIDFFAMCLLKKHHQE